LYFSHTDNIENAWMFINYLKKVVAA